MKTIQEGRELLDAQDAIVEAARNEMARIRAEMIEKFSPVKVGDVVEVNTYGHKGKKMRVDNVKITFGYFKPSEVEFRAAGRVLKKDGTPGLNSAEYRAAASVAPEEE